jgi:hypothetical protein
MDDSVVDHGAINYGAANHSAANHSAVNNRAVSDGDDFAALDDPALFSWREDTRAELERLPPESPDYAALTARYDQSTEEIDVRARAAWAKAVPSGNPSNNQEKGAHQ